MQLEIDFSVKPNEPEATKPAQDAPKTKKERSRPEQTKAYFSMRRVKGGYFWAVWSTQYPRRDPWRKPDHVGLSRTRGEAEYATAGIAQTEAKVLEYRDSIYAWAAHNVLCGRGPWEEDPVVSQRRQERERTQKEEFARRWREELSPEAQKRIRKEKRAAERAAAKAESERVRVAAEAARRAQEELNRLYEAAKKRNEEWERAQRAEQQWRSFKDFAQRVNRAASFAALGIPVTSSAQEVRKAFRIKASTTHPDVGGNHEDFVALNAAYREALAFAEMS